MYLYGDPKINITDYYVETHAIMAQRSPSTTDLAALSQRQEWLQMAEGIKENVTTQLLTIQKDDFADSLEKWKGRWGKCVRLQREHFKED